MGFAGEREKRFKQINVRLTKKDEQLFRYFTAMRNHQTVSDAVRELIREGHMTIMPMEPQDIAVVLKNLNRTDDDITLNQLNVRLNASELRMTTDLMRKMYCFSFSDTIRNLIDIYSRSIRDNREKARAIAH